MGEDMRVLNELLLPIGKSGTVPDLRITLTDKTGEILLQETLTNAEIDNAINYDWLTIAVNAGFAVEAGDTFDLELRPTRGV